ncbi:DUF4276 family protein [Marinobacter alexandrii]|uniref:DUF4276 family protein n=1 Tax=Marinobacter alexandrii TaxID=2570351 RepID=UPI002ABD605F|nr:DUF4276 family protein [Marinobacter alexandrii]
MSVEGATEREFVTKVLAPFLSQHGIYASPVDIRGKVSLDRISNELRQLIPAFDHVTTFYDYYGFHKRPAGGVVDVERSIQELVEPEQRRLLIPYVQLHEFEALVLAAPDRAEETLGVLGLADKLRTIVDTAGGAENVNDGYETCPSRRIKSLAPAYDKKLHGPIILDQSLDEVRNQCPRFNGWVTSLLLLA